MPMLQVVPLLIYNPAEDKPFKQVIFVISTLSICSLRKEMVSIAVAITVKYFLRER